MKWQTSRNALVLAPPEPHNILRLSWTIFPLIELSMKKYKEVVLHVSIVFFNQLLHATQQPGESVSPEKPVFHVFSCRRQGRQESPTHTTNNYCFYFIFSDSFSSITELVVEVEHQSNEYHKKWENVNETHSEFQSIQRELHYEMMKYLEDLSHPLTLPWAGKTTKQRIDLSTLYDKLCESLDLYLFTNFYVQRKLVLIFPCLFHISSIKNEPHSEMTDCFSSQLKIEQEELHHHQMSWR